MGGTDECYDNTISQKFQIKLLNEIDVFSQFLQIVSKYAKYEICFQKTKLIKCILRLTCVFNVFLVIIQGDPRFYRENTPNNRRHRMKTIFT